MLQKLKSSNPADFVYQYLVMGVLTILNFIFWFIPAVSISLLGFTESISLPEWLKLNDMGAFPTLYIIAFVLAMIGMAAAVMAPHLPHIVKSVGYYACVLIHVIGLIVCAMDTFTSASDAGIKAGFTFGGIMTIIIFIAMAVFDTMMQRNRKKAKKEAAAAKLAN